MASTPPPDQHGSTLLRPWRRRLLLAAATLTLAALLAPAPLPEPPPAPAGARPFAWHRDDLWERLEASFRDARSAGCTPVKPEAHRLAGAFDAALDELAGAAPEPGDPALEHAQQLLFALAPLAAACPDLVLAYANRSARLRTEVKRASRSWDTSSPAARDALYRLLYGSRAALEEVLLQQPAAAVPALLRGTDEPSATPASQLLGVSVHSGDLLVSRGGAPTSALIARGNDYPGNFSHVALLWVDPLTHEPEVIEAHIERGVVVSTLAEYLADTKLRVMVLRLRADLPVMIRDPMLPHRAATAALERTRAAHIPYDFAMDFSEHSRQFCSEVASAAYESVGERLWMGLSTLSSPGLRRWLAGFGVRHFTTQEPSDLEYDPQLVVVAEWRDPETLYRDHLDNAVTEVMLEGAERGDELACPWILLPVARIAKVWSVACNLAGRPGPVPEGMSAAAALRNRSYSARHRAIGERLRLLADRFAAESGYRPPYWQLVRLARAAAAREAEAGVPVNPAAAPAPAPVRAPSQA